MKNTLDLKLCPSCHAFQSSIERECPNCAYDLSNIEVYNKATKTPSLNAVILIFLIYMFGTFTILLVVGFIIRAVGSVIGTPKEAMKSLGVTVGHVLEFFFYLVMTVLLVRNYTEYFFPGSWKTISIVS